MKIHIRWFAALRDIVGQPGTSLELPADATVATAWQLLLAQWPQLAHTPGVMYAVNRAYATSTTPLHDGDELALIPPVSGG